ncbi:CHAT domain-containing protein [Dapis sp. BLCC M229]|uniref:CHAT domain-containing protein n=1 Tax=Dapis sp. BLCC M229 TaxID=3400188 RepID=UPI003CEB65CC
MELFELYLSPIDETRFTAIVSQSTASGDGGDTPSVLPDEGHRRITLIKTVEFSQFSADKFQDDTELDWMAAENIITASRNAFHPDYLAQIGQLFYKALFPPGSPVEKLLGQAIASAESQGKPLVVRLKFPADGVQHSRLADYPWELLHDGHKFLCHHSVKLSRYIAYKGVAPKLPPVEKLNILLVSSEAFSKQMGLKRLSRQEREAIRQGAKKAEEEGHISLTELEFATLKHLRDYLTEHKGEDSPHVIHFDGHGVFGQKCQQCSTIHKTTKRQQCRNCEAQLSSPQGYLVFEDEDGDPDYISAKELGTLLQQSALSDGSSQTQGVVLVVLSACQSGMAIAGESVFNGAAQNLIAHRVPAVVAMQYSVRVDSATKFAEQFYRSLGQKNSLAMAVSQGRSAMGVDGNQWYRPVLYLRWQDNEGGQLFVSESFPITKFHVPKLSGSSVFVRRDEEIEKIIKALLELDQSKTVIALWSPRGYGKTTLAKLIGWEASIQQHYSGGIYWIEIKNDLDAKKALKKLYSYLTNIEKDVEPEDFLDKWNQKPTLVILDNIEDEEELDLFLRSVGESSQLLITTERLDTFKKCNNFKLIQINPLNLEELITVLKYPLKKERNFNDLRIKELADLLYNWPVLLNLALEKIQQFVHLPDCPTSEVIIDNVIEEIREINWSDRKSPINQNIKQSFKYLTEKEKEHFHSLFIFSADLNIPFSVIAIIWDLPSSTVKHLCLKLYQLSLLREFNISRKIIQLNSLLQKYFRSVSDPKFKQFLVDVNKKFVKYYEKKYELNSPDDLLDNLPDNLPLEERNFLRRVYRHHWKKAKKYKL